MHVDVLQDLAELGAHDLAGTTNEHLVRAACRLATHIALRVPTGGQAVLQVDHAGLAGNDLTNRERVLLLNYRPWKRILDSDHTFHLIC